MVKYFNPRPREGGDQGPYKPTYLLIYFNPRPREGGDKGHIADQQRQLISIHAPARGATQR